MSKLFKNHPVVQTHVIRKMISETGVDPRNIYCQITGAPIGRLSREEFRLIWLSLDATRDPESIVDELYARTVASMRPSPAWNFIRTDTLNRLRIADPMRVCAYLLGRYFEPHDPAYSRIKRTYEDRIQDGVNRIITYDRLSSARLDSGELQQFTLYLLLLDSQFDLSICEYIPGFPQTPDDLNPMILREYIPTLKSYFDLLVAKKFKLEKEAKLQSSWLAHGGNRGLSDATRKLFFETKPDSEATLKKKAKDSVVNMMAAVLRGLMDGPDDSTPDAPIVAPMKPSGFKFKLPSAGAMPSPATPSEDSQS